MAFIALMTILVILAVITYVVRKQIPRYVPVLVVIVIYDAT